MSTREALLFSGGLDSYITWRLLGKQPECLYVRLGHAYEARELQAIQTLQREHAMSLTLEVASVGSWFGQLEEDDGHIPHRNLVLVAAAAAAGARKVYLAAVLGETSRDKTRRFFRDSSKLLSFLERPVQVVAPFRHLTKAELVAAYLRRFPMEHDRQILSLTRSCYRHSIPDDRPCGVCQACLRRWVAMTRNGITEEYQSDPAERFGHLIRHEPGHPLSRLIRTPLREWPGVIRTNAEALHALLERRDA